MNAAVVGFDIGYDSCYIAIAKGGGIETIVNEYSDRKTPTCVSFGTASRYIGTSAKQLVVSNLRNSVFGFTRFLGKKYSDPVVQEDLRKLTCQNEQLPGDRIGLVVQYMKNKTVFTPEQLLAMQLTKLKEIAELDLSSKILDVVINVPNYFTNRERRACLDAAQIADLNCVRLINDTTAAGVAYGMYHKDLPPADQPAKNVILVDMGAASLRASFCQFNDGKLKVIASTWDSNLGGRDFDRVLFTYFAKGFVEKYKIDVFSSAKASVRLMQECEKVKKLMSSNSTVMPLNIECFMDDKDVTGNINRETFEDLATTLLQRAEMVFVNLLAEAKSSVDDVHIVEIIGGSTRLPAIKALASKVFGKELSTTLNCDEAVARGCAFQSAILSPAFRVRDFNITDANPYPILVSYNEYDKQDCTFINVFSKWDSFPFSRAITLHRREPFTLNALYGDHQSILPDERHIGEFLIKDVQPSNSELAKVKVKVRINIHGIFTVSQAQQIDRVEKQVPVKVEEKTDKTDKVAPPETGAAAATSMEAETPASDKGESPVGDANMNVDAKKVDEKEEVPKKGEKEAPTPEKMEIRYVNKTTDLPVVSNISYLLDSSVISNYCDIENEMIMQDKLERERSLAKNSVEEYVYETRDKLSSQWEPFGTNVEKEVLLELLTNTEDWLYGEGEDLNKQSYIDKLKALRLLGDKIASRSWEFINRSTAADALGVLCKRIDGAIVSFQNGEELYDHIDANEIKNLAGELEKVQRWYTQEMVAQSKLKKYDDPSLTVAQLQLRRQNLEGVAKTILNKPKPKVEPPPAPVSQDQKNENSVAPNDTTAEASEGSENQRKSNDMDVD